MQKVVFYRMLKYVWLKYTSFRGFVYDFQQIPYTYTLSHSIENFDEFVNMILMYDILNIGRYTNILKAVNLFFRPLGRTQVSAL